MIGITELIGEVVEKTGKVYGEHINYIFGNSEYIKEQLDVYSNSSYVDKLPLIALFCPVTESRGGDTFYSSAKVSLLIACSTTKDLTNEEREEESFRKVLRPIYEALKCCLLADSRLDFGYKPRVRHEYSENYSYGRYGAYTTNNGELSEPIDAIDIRNLEINIKEFNTCKR